MRPMFSRLAWLALAVVIHLPNAARAEDDLPGKIDRLIAAKPDFSKHAAARCDDAEFLRRVTLDLTGTIPTAQEVRTFLDDRSADKRRAAVERLLGSPAHADHLATVFDVMLMDRRANKHVPQKDWEAFLTESFAKNLPYDRLVSAILEADGSDPKQRGPARFFLDREAEAHLTTKDLGRLFLGMNLECAQCHDHPVVEHYRQDFYYGIYAFLDRTFLFKPKGSKVSILAEKGEGTTSFQSVFNAKVTKTIGLHLPEGAMVKEPAFPKGKEYKVPYKKGEKPEPKFSRREQLAKSLTSHPRFARTAANRLWFLLLGRGLVHPVDLDHPANPPSNPELLDLLTKEFAASGHDVRKLIRSIVLSETYQRSSRPPAGATAVPAEMFATAALRPMTPEQFARSLLEATGVYEAERKALGAKATEKAVRAKTAAQEAAIVKVFAGQPGEPFDPTAFEANLDQTLFLRNGGPLLGLLAARPGSLTHRLGQLKDAGAVVEEAFVSVLGRRPTAEESRDLAGFLTGKGVDPTIARRDLVWALATSVEFRFNH